MDIAVHTVYDIPTARRAMKTVAQKAGLCVADVAVVALCASELAANLARYAAGGRLIGAQREAKCMILRSQDQGAGIPDIEAAMVDGFSTGGGLGGGLGTVYRLMDTFRIESSSTGTTIEATKCCQHRTP